MAWLALMAVLLVGALASGAQAQGESSVSDSYIVTFSAGTSDSAARDLLSSVDATVDSHIAPLRMYSVSLPSSLSPATLEADPSVSRVDADLARAVATAPSDPNFSAQWALSRIGWEAARDTVTPTGSATVAILDTGVDASHPDLDGNLVAGTSILLGGSATTDPNGHGTQMAGIVAAETDNAEGVAGVGYAGVKVMPVTVLGADGTGQDSDIIQGVVWAADHGADVILMSFSNPGYSESLQAAIDYAWSQNVVLVAATGNGGSSDPTFPAGDRGVIGVSSTGLTDGLSSTSNYGPAAFLAAPGEGVLSTTAGGGYVEVSGTSASAAIVAGSAALLRASSVGASNGVIVSRLARNAEPAGTPEQTGNGRVELSRAIVDSSSDSVQPAGAAPVGGGGPFVGPYTLAANNDAHVAPGWAATNSTVTFSALYRKTTGGTVQHVRLTLPVGYTNISVAATAFSSGTWSTPVVNQVLRTIDVQLTAGTGLATNNVSWARIDVTATTPPANQSGNAAEWLMQTFTNTAGTAGEQNDNPPVLIGTTTTPSATITFVDASNNPIVSPVLQDGIAATVRVRITQSGSGIKYTDVAVPTCFSSPTGVTTTVSTGGNGGYSPTVTDGFIRLPGGSIPNNGFLTVQFTTTPNCVSGTYLVSSDPSTNASNPPSGTNQSVSTTGGSLTVAAGLADLSITKTDSPDPVERGGTLTYTIGVANAGPDDASAVKVVDTLPANTTFVSATGANWNCNNVSGTVTCNRTGGNLAAGASAPNITITVTAPPTSSTGTITINNSATVSSPNDVTPGNNTATAATVVSTPPSLTLPTFSPTSPTTNTNLQASTTTSDVDGDQISVAWVWKVTRGANTCTISTDSSALAAGGLRTVSLDLSQSYATSSCTGATPPASINPSKGDVVIVEATPTDAPGLSGTMKTSSVTIANTAPTVTLSSANDLTVNEGSTHTYAYTIADADGDTIASVSTSCGLNGNKSNPSNTDASGSFDCTFPDGPASSTVSAQATDSGFGAAAGNTATQSVTVANVAPTVAFIASPASANEGQTKTYTYSISDPGADTVTSVATSCGANGTKTNASNTDTSGTFDCTFPDGPANSTVSAQATDSDGAAGTTASQLVAIANVAPTVPLTGQASVNEGSSHIYSFTTSDPGADTFVLGATDCGTGASQVGADTFNAATGAGSFECSFPDGPASPTISVTVSDSDGASDSDTLAVTVNNVKPSISLSGAATADEGDTKTYSYTVTDPGVDTHTITTDCGANGDKVALSDSYSAGTGLGSFGCFFADGPATTNVTAAVTDSDGASDTDNQIVVVTVNNVAPTVTLTGQASVNEGSTHTYSFTTSDPGEDTFTLGATDCGTGGTQVGPDTFNAATGAGSFDCSFPDGPTSPIVSVTVSDSDGGSDSDTLGVTVTNVAPTVTLTGLTTVNEGSSHIYSFTTTDPGSDSFVLDATDCGTGGTQVGPDTFSAATGAGSFECSFPDGPASPIVSVTVSDSDGASDSDTLAVTVNNVAPTVSLAAGNDLSVNEGTNHTYSFTVSDPGTDTFSVVSVSCGANGSQVGTTATTAGGGSFVCSFPDGPASSIVSVQVKDSDDALSNTASQTVTVNNVAPTVSLTGDVSVAEGSTHTYSFTVSDPGADTFVLDATDCGTGGSQVGADTFNATTGAGTFECSFPDGPASPIVSVTVSDSDGASDSDTLAVTVNNVAPTVSLSAANDLSVNEGTNHTYSFSVSDPGTDTFSVVSVSCGANGSQVGTTTTNASGGSFVCSFPDGPASSIVSVQVKDSDDALSNTATQTVTVANVAPTVSLSAANDLSVNEGTNHTYSFTVSDPGTDTFSVVSVSCGANGSQVGTTTTNASGGSFVCSFPDGPASSIVSVQVKDSDDALSNTATQTVAIANVAPTVSLTGDATAAEGSTHTYSFTTTDPGADTFALDATECGTGGSQVGADTFNAATGAGSFVCSFPDGPASPTVSVTVSDSDGASDSDTLGVTVNNVKPSISLTGAATADEGETKTYSYTVTDPGVDTHTITTACGANGAKVAASDSYNAGTGAGSFKCFFADGPATTNVTATVTDSDGATDTDNQVVVVTVSNVAPTVTLSGANDLSVNEGSSHTYSFTTSDPGEDAFSLLSVDCGLNGSQVGTAAFSTSTGAGSFVCSFPDGPANSTVSVQVEDSDGADSNTATQAVAIANVAPTVTLTGQATVNEGTSHTYSFTTTDPGADTFVLDTTDCGMGGSQVGADTFSASTGAGSFECSFPDGPASPIVSVTVSDSDGASDSDTLGVTVNNVAPTVTLTGQATVNEGTSHTYSFTTTDPGADTFVLDTTDCGTGGSQVGVDTFNAATGAGSFACSFPDGPASPIVSVSVSDSDGASDSDSITVAVANVKPSISLTGPATADEGETKHYTFSVTDPGADTHTLATDCGTNGAKVSGSDSYDGSTKTGSFDCFFADGPATTNVTAKVTDSDGASDTDNQVVVVTVSNVAPTVTLIGANSADEGEVKHYSFTTVDPGTDTFVLDEATCDANGSKSNELFDADTGAGSFDCTFPDGPASSTVSVTVSDSDGLSDSDSITVTITNVAPTVSLAAGNDLSVNEGSNHTYSFTVDDPGTDGFTVVSVSCGLDGDQVGTTATTAGGGSFVCSFPDGPANSTVSVQVKDSDNANSNTASQTVAIANVAPTVTLALGNALTVNEGSTHTYSYTISDPGDDTVTSVTTSCSGTGSKVAVSDSFTNTSGSFQCSFADGPNSSTVSASATDSDEATGPADTQTVTVNNVAPVVALSGPNSANPGDTKTYTFTISDPAGAADAQSYVAGYPDCGAFGTVTGTPTITYNGGSFQCTFSAGLSSTVAVKVNDGDANSNEDSIVVSLNRAPSVDAGPDVSGSEGSAISLDGTVSDPDGNTYTVKWTYTAGAGVDAGATCAFANDTAVDTTINCTDDGTFTAKLEATDQYGAKSSDTTTVTVSNANPIVTAPNPTPAPYAKGTLVSLSVNFTDAGKNDTHKTPPGGSCMVSWDDATPNTSGTVTEPVGSTAGTCTASHSYAGPGVYTVTFTVTDDDGGSGTATIQVVVYDPNGGFITGGGWINVGAGSYTANPTLTGRANFGFMSQYKKNAMIPTGETEFNFQVGNMNFHSTAYSWLVVSGYKAQYKGTGTINGSGNYNFTLTAYDGNISGGGGTDRFRMRITDGNNGNAVIFDNKNGVPTDMDVADPQVIAGGSIVIHKA